MAANSAAKHLPRLHCPPTMSPSPPHTHTHKRPFRHDPHHQQSLTSYFSPILSSSSASTSPSVLSTTNASLLPSIQTSLLHVGMRVRKSIGDGYKLQTPMSSLKSTNTMPQARVLLRNGYLEKEDDSWSIQRDSTVPSEEDLPGLLFPDEEEEEEDGWPSSQESNLSSSRIPSPSSHLPPSRTSTRKRIWQDEDDGNDGEGGSNEKEDIAFTALNYVPTNSNDSHNTMQIDRYPQISPQVRAAALPKIRRKRAVSSQELGKVSALSAVAPRGRREVNTSSRHGPDFEDAAFFRAEEWMDIE